VAFKVQLIKVYYRRLNWRPTREEKLKEALVLWEGQKGFFRLFIGEPTGISNGGLCF